MARRNLKGISLYTVLVLVSVLSMLAATMTAIYTMSWNFTQGFSNDDAAFSEAESGLSETMARLTADPTFGTHTEEIRTTVTPDMDPDQAFHVVSFQDGTGFARSTNNLDGNQSSGALGKTVPPGAVQVISTGYCRGRWCCVEAVVHHPPFPYGVATSGPINSTALVVEGKSSASATAPDRPGDLVSNSPDGITVSANPNSPTYISGFAKSVGPISVAQPATIVGGIRPRSDAVSLPSFNVTSFRNQGQAGVATVIDSEYGAPQNLNIMYYSGHGLTYDAPVNLNNAFLYVDGDLTINGGLSGQGAVVVNGSVLLNGGASLKGTNNVALLASGNITMAGNGDYFQGVVYSKTGLTARKLSVLGSAIVSSDVPGQGGADLQEVTVISTSSGASMHFQASSVTSSSGPLEATSGGQMPFVFDPKTNAPMSQPTNTTAITHQGYNVTVHFTTDPGQAIENVLASGDASAFDNLPLDKSDPDTAPVAAAFSALGPLMTALQKAEAAVKAAQNTTYVSGYDDQGNPIISSPDPAAVQAAELERHRAEGAFQAGERAAVDAFNNFKKVHTQSDGSYGGGGGAGTLVVKDYSFDLNTYMPVTDIYRVSYCKVYGYKL